MYDLTLPKGRVWGKIFINVVESPCNKLQIVLGSNSFVIFGKGSRVAALVKEHLTSMFSLHYDYL